MATQPTVKDILEKAIEREIKAQNLYSELSQKMNEEVAKNTFQDLSRQEQGHQKLLEKYLRGELKEGALSRGHPIDYKIAEHFNQPAVSADMELKDIFLMAASREKISHEVYLSLAAVHPDGEVKRLLEGIAAQELEHKQRVEFLYTEVAFPQTDGG